MEINDNGKYSLCTNLNMDRLTEILNTLSPFFSSFQIISTTHDQCHFEGELKLDNPHCDYRFSRTANVTLTLNPNSFVEQMPVVKVNELWMHKSADWHCYQDGSICWELEERWKSKLAEIKCHNPPQGDFLNFAISWCLESSICLISRHWYAHTSNITEWPKEWKYWAHGTEGKKDYERGKRKHERKKSKRTH